MTAVPVFKNQTFKQVINICSEFDCKWENKWQFQDQDWTNLIYEVYIYDDKLYTKISE